MRCCRKGPRAGATAVRSEAAGEAPARSERGAAVLVSLGRRVQHIDSDSIQLLGVTLALVLIGLANNLAVMLATLFAVGAATGAGVVIWGTLLQRLVPPEMIGRVASLDFFVSIAFMPVSIAIAGPLSLVVPIPAIFIVAGVAPTLLAVVALVAGRMRHVETRQPLDT